jgi:hypothetical protein
MLLDSFLHTNLLIMSECDAESWIEQPTTIWQKLVKASGGYKHNVPKFGTDVEIMN